MVQNMEYIAYCDCFRSDVHLVILFNPYFFFLSFFLNVDSYLVSR